MSSLEDAKNLSQDLEEKDQNDFLIKAFKDTVQDMNNWMKELDERGIEITTLLQITEAGFCKGIMVSIYKKL